MKSDGDLAPLRPATMPGDAEGWRKAARRLLPAHRVQPFYWREAALCVPGLPALVLIGRASGQPSFGVVAAGAAFSVGFGAARDLRGRRWGAMLGAAAGMTVAAMLGAVAGASPVFSALCGLVAAACAALALIDENLWWVTLQVLIALLVAGYYPGSGQAAVDRGLAVLGGGAIEIATIVLLARLVPAAANPLPANARPLPTTRLRLWTHAIRAALCVTLSLEVARRIGLANNYWAPMTAAIVLKPGLHETRARGFARVGGTLLGCVLATLYAWVCRDQPALLIIGLSLSAGAAFALQKAHYASLTTAITATVVLMLSLVRAGVLANAEHRIMATLLGGAIAMLGAVIVPHRRPPAHPREDRVGG